MRRTYGMTGRGTKGGHHSEDSDNDSERAKEREGEVSAVAGAHKRFWIRIKIKGPVD